MCHVCKGAFLVIILLQLSLACKVEPLLLPIQPSVWRAQLEHFPGTPVQHVRRAVVTRINPLLAPLPACLVLVGNHLKFLKNLHFSVGAESNANRTACDVCQAGSYFDKNQTCQICPNKTYQPTPGQSSCIPCRGSNVTWLTRLTKYPRYWMNAEDADAIFYTHFLPRRGNVS